METKGSLLILETMEEVAAYAVLTGIAVPIAIEPKDNSLPMRILFTHSEEAEDAAIGVREQLNGYPD